MYRKILFRSSLLTAILLLTGLAQAQERKSRIHLDSYVIDADINQHTQSLAAKAAARFTPLDELREDLHLGADRVVERQRQSLADAVENRERCRVVPERFRKNIGAFSVDDCGCTIGVRQPPSWAVPRLRRGRMRQHPSFRRSHLFTERNQLIHHSGCNSGLPGQPRAFQQDSGTYPSDSRDFQRDSCTSRAKG